MGTHELYYSLHPLKISFAEFVGWIATILSPSQHVYMIGHFLNLS